MSVLCRGMFWQPIIFSLTFLWYWDIKNKMKGVMSLMNEVVAPKRSVRKCFFFFLHLFCLNSCFFVVGWATVPASGGGLFRHLLHLTSVLAAVVIFWLNDAWKWISIFCDQKRYVMAVRYMHYKQPGCSWKWKHHTGLREREEKHGFQLSSNLKRLLVLYSFVHTTNSSPHSLRHTHTRQHQHLPLKRKLMKLTVLQPQVSL